MGFAVVALAAASAVTGALSSYNSGVYQSQVAQNNARIAKYNETLALQKGQQEAQISGLRTGQTLGKQRAAAGAAGIDADVGSPERLQGDTKGFGAQDQLTLTNNAALQGWGYNTQANSFLAESGLDRSKAVTSAVGSLIGGASDTTDKWQQWKDNG